MAKYTIFLNIIKLACKYPSSFFRQLNTKNLGVLKRALMNEPPSQIISNIKNLILKTNNVSIEKSKKSIAKFGKLLKTDSERNYCIFITHEATRTGAPLILLKLGQELLKIRNYKPIFIICKTGALNSEFKESGLSYTLQFPHLKNLLRKEISELLSQFVDKKIQGVFFNSEGSTFLLEHFAAYKIGPRISLIHEMGDYYPKNAWKHINKYSDNIVFPANEMKKQAINNTKFEKSKLNVIGQGLIKPELLDVNKRKASTKLRAKLGIPEDSFIVLGCGTPIPRKGIDIFILTATSYLSQYKDLNTYFLWLGDAPQNEHQIWAKRDIEQSGFHNNIILQDSVEDISVWFSGSNIFYLTSRGDPFPCVIQEALASRLPTIGFSGSGGYSEMITSEIGFVIPYGNIAASLDIIDSVQKDKKRFEKICGNTYEYAKINLDFSNYAKHIYSLIN